MNIDRMWHPGILEYHLTVIFVTVLRLRILMENCQKVEEQVVSYGQIRDEDRKLWGI